jgi:hypothetical protein
MPIAPPNFSKFPKRATVILEFSKYNGSTFEKTETDVDYIEIGACDWDIMSQTHSNLRGIVVEPIKLYLNKIPHNDNVKKCNCAISDTLEQGNMYYIPPHIIETNSIISHFRGMNKLNSYHMGHESNNLTEFVIKESCEVITYFTLLDRYGVTYVDFLKIDTEGNDCTIINNILDELHLHPNYILPRYIYFENNCLTSLERRTDTIHRLYQNGYVHISTIDDNTLMYNCTTHYLKNLQQCNISLPVDNILHHKSDNFFQDVHSYMTYGQVDLFRNILNISVVNDPQLSNIIWTTQDINDYTNFLQYSTNNPSIKLINVVHGGGFIFNNLLNISNLNLMVKSFTDYKHLIDNHKHNICLFIGKYKCKELLLNNIFVHREQNYKRLSSNFLMLNGFFNINPEAVKSTYIQLSQHYSIDLYGYDSPLGWADIFENTIVHDNILSKYKFMLHLKGNGYLCNSVICALMVGMPIIMSRDVYINTLYYQFIPQELIILCDNNNINSITSSEVIPSLEYAINMSDTDYLELSKKLYIHGTFFREYYDFELKHLYHFMNNLAN